MISGPGKFNSVRQSSFVERFKTRELRVIRRAVHHHRNSRQTRGAQPAAIARYGQTDPNHDHLPSPTMKPITATVTTIPTRMSHFDRQVRNRKRLRSRPQR